MLAKLNLCKNEFDFSSIQRISTECCIFHGAKKNQDYRDLISESVSWRRNRCIIGSVGKYKSVPH